MRVNGKGAGVALLHGSTEVARFENGKTTIHGDVEYSGNLTRKGNKVSGIPVCIARGTIKYNSTSRCSKYTNSWEMINNKEHATNDFEIISGTYEFQTGDIAYVSNFTGGSNSSWWGRGSSTYAHNHTVTVDNTNGKFTSHPNGQCNTTFKKTYKFSIEIFRKF